MRRSLISAYFIFKEHMDITKYLLPDSEGAPSTTRSVFFYGCMICLTKLAVSGVTIGPLALGSFGGSDFALAIGALGGIYSLDKVVRKPNA